MLFLVEVLVQNMHPINPCGRGQVAGDRLDAWHISSKASACRRPRYSPRMPTHSLGNPPPDTELRRPRGLQSPETAQGGYNP